MAQPKGKLRELWIAISLEILLSCSAFSATQTLGELNAALDQPIQPQDTGSCPASEKVSMVRPDPAGQPTLVGLAILFQDVYALSDVDQSVTADIYVIARWRDLRLADLSRGEASIECTSSLKSIWTPAIGPENLRATQRFYEDRILVNSRGIITLVRRIIVQVAQPMDFTDFPLDHHIWRFTLVPAYSDSSEMLLHALPWTSGPVRPTIQGWLLASPNAQVTLRRRANRLGVFAQFEATLEVRRMPQFYIWVLGIPLILIGMMAYLAYFVPPTIVPQQIALGMTAILTAMAYMFTLNSNLPKIGYMTRADRLFVAIIALAFLSLVKSVATAALESRRDVIARVDWIGRRLYPAVVAAALIIAFLL